MNGSGLLERKVDGRASCGQWIVLGGNGRDLLHHILSLLHLTVDITRLVFEPLKSCNDVVLKGSGGQTCSPEDASAKVRGEERAYIVKDGTLRLVESFKEGLLKVPKADLELALQLHEIDALLVNVGPLCLENLVKALLLK